MKIVIPESISPRGIQELEAQPGWNIVTLTPASVQSGELERELRDADGLIVRSAVKVTPELLDRAPQLKVVGRAGIGVDNVNLDAATRKGVVVMNTPGGSAVSVAELTIALMVALARKLPAADSSTRAGKWEKKSLQGSELSGKTLGIIGLGRIGLEVARRARAFEMEIVAFDPFVSTVLAREAGARMTDFDELLAQADYISLHLSLTPETEKIVNAESLARMKRGVRLINCARGELVDEAALTDALKSGQVAGAALDVFAKEPPGALALFSLPNVIATPHIAGSTDEAQDRVGHRIAVQVRDYLAQGIIQNAVNVSSISYEDYKELQPWLELGQKLGTLLAQLVSGQPRELSLRYAGELADWNTDLIRNSVIAGLLNRVLDEKANLVNARSLAEKRGIALHEGKWRSSFGLARSLSVLLRTDEEQLLLHGAVFHGSQPRLLALDDIELEAPLSEHLLVARNDDVPGVIGHIGTVLGRRGINIASFALGRQEIGDATEEQLRKRKPLRAVAIVQVDAAVPADVVAELQQHPAVHLVRSVAL
jgi:D-3-phosphoglycerate dehydrogenase